MLRLMVFAHFASTRQRSNKNTACAIAACLGRNLARTVLNTTKKNVDNTSKPGAIAEGEKQREHYRYKIHQQ
jgi:hypothetical protein